MPPAPKTPKAVEPKPKRTLSEDQLAKLKVAREKALEVKKAMKEKSDDKKIKHYEEKIMKIKGKKPDEPPVEEELENLEIDEEEEEITEPEPEPEPEPTYQELYEMWLRFKEDNDGVKKTLWFQESIQRRKKRINELKGSQ